MVSVPSFDTGTAAPAVRKPAFAVSFGSGGSGGGMVSALGSAIGVDLGAGGDKWKNAVLSISVEAGLAPSVDAATVSLLTGELAPEYAVDDDGSVSLGYDDSSTDLAFTGKIDSIRYSVAGRSQITATNGGARLSRLRVNQSYEQQKAGDIIKDLTGRVEVDTDTIEDGIDLPFYVVDDRRNAYQHIATLAKKSGLLAFFTTEGKLSVITFADGEPLQTFKYGQDILSLQITDSTPQIGAVSTIGDGAAGSKGADAWGWLVKDPSSVKGSAGDGAANRDFTDSALRSSDAAQTAADAISSGVQMAQSVGRLLVSGAPAVVVGGSIEVTDAPADSMNGKFLVRGLRHLYSKREGFTTLISFSKTGSGSGSGSLGGLL